MAKYKTSNAAKDAWNARAYEFIKLRVYRGDKELIEAAALAAGDSVNKYIGDAVLARIGIDKWPHEPERAE